MLEILDWTYAYRKLMVVDTACELDIFTRLQARASTAEDLAKAVGAELVPFRAMLDVCVGIGLLQHESGYYSNSPTASVYLVRQRPLYLGDLFRVYAAEANQWLSLKELVTRGRVEGHAPVDIGAKRFTRAMNSLGLLGEATALVNAIDLSKHRRLIDVGCGSGIYSISLCERYPSMSAILLDRPEVLEVTEEFVATSSVSQRIELKPGDLFDEPFGDDRDAVLLSDVLYLEADRCRELLKKSYEALISGGVIIIRGYFSDPDGCQNQFGAFFDLCRIFWDANRDPLPRRQIVEWLGQIGFTDIDSFQLTERSIGVTGIK